MPSPLQTAPDNTYQRIAKELLREIQREHVAGDLLPSENTLAERFGVNRHTVRRATDELARQGILRKRRGFGTEVCDPSLHYPLQRAMRFTATLESLDLCVATELIHKGVQAADEQVALALDLPPRSPVVHLRTLRIVESWPMLVSDLFLADAQYHCFIEHFTGGSTYAFMREHCGFQPIRRTSQVGAVAAEDADARQLRVPPGSPLLRVLATDIHPIRQQPVLFARILFRADRVQLEVHS